MKPGNRPTSSTLLNMDLFILRHGIAVELGEQGCTRDADRQLTPEGKRKVRQVAQAMTKLDVCIDLILTSPYARARQTAEIVRDVFRAKPGLQLTDDLAPGGAMRVLIASIRKMSPAPESLLLVGHEPYLGGLISLLVSGNRDLQVDMKKAGLCRLSVDVLENARCATLQWLLTPRQMMLMA